MSHNVSSPYSVALADHSSPDPAKRIAAMEFFCGAILTCYGKRQSDLLANFNVAAYARALQKGLRDSDGEVSKAAALAFYRMDHEGELPPTGKAFLDFINEYAVRTKFKPFNYISVCASNWAENISNKDGRPVANIILNWRMTSKFPFKINGESPVCFTIPKDYRRSPIKLAIGGFIEGMPRMEMIPLDIPPGRDSYLEPLIDKGDAIYNANIHMLVPYLPRMHIRIEIAQGGIPLYANEIPLSKCRFPAAMPK